MLAANANPTDQMPPAVDGGVSAADSPLRYVHTEGLPQLFNQLGISLAVTTYQAGKLMLIRPAGEKLSLLMRSFEKPMGIAVSGQGRMAVGCRSQIWVLANAPDLRDETGNRVPHDAYYLPRRSHVTGDILGHELAWGHNGELWIVNTRFSCLATLDEAYSFVPRWRPPFVTACVPEDRCHLNGLALDGGRPKFVSALGQTDVRQGWRPGKRDGGCLIDVDSGEAVTTGLSMPHSPRLALGKLWVLESGRGELQIVDAASGTRECVCRLPGYTRGLAFHDRYAFIGLSQIREKHQFGGLPIEQAFDRLKCAVYVIDVRSGREVGFIEFQTACEELFDVQVLPGAVNPHVVGLQKDTINGAFVVPPQGD